MVQVVRYLIGIGFAILLLAQLASFSASAQTSTFTYQGKLSDSGAPANGIYDVQFKIFDTATVGTGAQQGPTITNSAVTVTAGVFTVQLDFGAAVFSGLPRFLELGVRLAGDLNTYNVLAPRQPVTSTPYAVRSLNSSVADVLSSSCVGCVTSSQIGSVSGSVVSGTIPVASVPAGSNSYLQNTTSPQAAANFNISGDGTAGGSLSANAVNATTQYNISGIRAFIASSFSRNVFAGVNAGAANGIGGSNSFFGHGAGESTAAGANNSFFGKSAGNVNTASNNSFFGADAGLGNSSGARNSLFGLSAGRNNQTGSDDAFFGYQAGLNNTASFNSFFGSNAGNSNTSGKQNAFFGFNAGQANTANDGNSFFGYNAGAANTLSENSFFGASAGEANTSGTFNAFFGYHAGQANTTTSGNTFFGHSSGASNTVDGNSFFGKSAGATNTTGIGNSFFGYLAGWLNTTGMKNSTFGYQAGQSNLTGENNSFFGYSAGRVTTVGGNSFFGSDAGGSNTSGSGNAFFGSGAGESNTTGTLNAFFGTEAGGGSTGDANTFIGNLAGNKNNTGHDNTFIGHASGAAPVSIVGSNNTLLGSGSNLLGTLNFATAIGADSFVSTSNTIALGRPDGSDLVEFYGRFQMDTLGPASNPVCYNGANRIGSCSSSLRYKTQVQSFLGGLDIVRRLRPISFNWKEDGLPDLGLGAEEVAKVEPRLTFRNKQGEIEGVKYNQVSAVLVNAVQQQQAQIAAQQSTIEQQQQQLKRQQDLLQALKVTVCQRNKRARVCK
jgi:hypothetical protein